MKGHGSTQNCFRIFIYFLVLYIRSIHSIPIDNSLVGAKIAKECEKAPPVDLAFVVDGSGSIGDSTFALQQNFINMLLDHLDVGPNGTHVGLVQFSGEPRLEISFLDHTDKRNLQWAISRVQYLSGTTNTGSALKFTLEKLIKQARGGNIPKVAIVLTDGQSQDKVAEAAEALRANQVLMYAIGVTNLVNVNELYRITGSPNRVFTVQSFDQLDEPLSVVIMAEMCKYEFTPGTPEIVCENDRIGVRAKTKNPFEGNVFVKGHYHVEGCRKGADEFPNPTHVGLTIPFMQCDIRRWRSLNPRGVYVETTVIFMFHNLFMTKIDQAVKIQCFYMEADKTVDVPIDVSMITTEFAENIYPMPKCTYSLHEGEPTGPLVSFAQIGQNIYHVWECIEHNVQYDTFGMLVHSCYVDDGSGDKVDLIDPNGCGVDIHLLGTPEYETSLRVAFKESHVFKYADRPLLMFQCQITVCIKYDGGCQGITPPHCNGNQRIRREQNRHISISTNTLDVLTNTVTVFEPDLNTPSRFGPKSSLSNEASSQQQQHCITHTNLIFIVGTITFAYLLVAISAGLYFQHRHRRTVSFQT